MASEPPQNKDFGTSRRQLWIRLHHLFVYVEGVAVVAVVGPSLFIAAVKHFTAIGVKADPTYSLRAFSSIWG
jgi:hypothetical protein